MLYVVQEVSPKYILPRRRRSLKKPCKCKYSSTSFLNSVTPHSFTPHSVTPHSGHFGWEVAKLRLHRTGGHQCCGKQCNTCFADISCQKHPTSGETLDRPWQWHWMALKMTICEHYTCHIAHLTESNTGNLMNGTESWKPIYFLLIK